VFDKGLIYRVGIEKKVDIGMLAETLFFYRNTHLLLDRTSVLALAQKMPHHVLLELFDRDVLQLSYIRQQFCIVSNGIPPAHDVGAYTFGGAAGQKLKNYQEEIAETLERNLGRSEATRKLAHQIAERVSLHRFRGVPEKEKSVADLAREDIDDPQYIERAVGVTLSHLIPGFSPPNDLKFRTMKVAGVGYVVDTNLDLERLNETYHRFVSPDHSSISVPYLLAHIVDARVDTFFAAYYMAELVAIPPSSDLMQLKHFEFLRRRNEDAKDINLFHELVIPEFPSIREVINSNERSLQEFLKLLDRASKFKKWLSQTNPDVGLIRSYYKEVTKKSWAETLPGKSIRFLVAAGAAFGASGAVGPAGGFGVGATNTFFVDRLLKGWRPNRFIEGPYKKFVSGAS